ncbi:MAG TPA: amidohydrolase [Candidatus Limivicinus faecipullorum]|nr:amidohydrolase [Candidatus Limivicinus faecipullorum]
MIRFYNGKTLSFGGGMKLSGHEVWVDGSTIVYVGPAKEDMPVFQRQIDLKGDLLIPGFKDAHTHTAMVFLRSYADDLPLQDWLYNKVFPHEARLTPEAVYQFTRLGILEYLSSGITASFDMYYYNEAYAKANVDCGFRTVICSAMNDFDADPTNIEREYLRFNNYSELVSYKLGIHAEYTTGLQRMEYMASLAEKYQAPCYMHCCETRAEVEGCLERHGLTPPQLLGRMGLFNYGGAGFHCVWMSDEDIELFARKGIYAVTNPASNVKLASGVAPVDKMLSAGVPMAIGTDGAASNNALDMFREMYLASCMQKLSLMDASAGKAEEILTMACAGGARAMGLDDCDDIAPGKKADLCVIDLHRPNMQPELNIPKNLVYSGSKENVRLTMVNGRILYENGEFFVGEEPEEIYRQVNRLCRSIL